MNKRKAETVMAGLEAVNHINQRFLRCLKSKTLSDRADAEELVNEFACLMYCVTDLYNDSMVKNKQSIRMSMMMTLDLLHNNGVRGFGCGWPHDPRDVEERWEGER